MQRDELRRRIAAHDEWLANPTAGRRLELEGVALVQQDLSRLHFRRARFTDVTFEGVDLSDSRFLECEFARARFKQSTLARVDFTDSQLTDLSFEECDVQDGSLAYTKGSKIRIQSSNFARTNLTKAFWTELMAPGLSCLGSNLRRMTLDNANLLGARLLEAKLVAVSFTNVDLRGAVLQGSVWTRAHLTRVRFGGATGQASNAERVVAEDVDVGDGQFRDSDEIVRALSTGAFTDEPGERQG
jgi:uncharacterized protein YjbI with pentapeptide repeats